MFYLDVKDPIINFEETVNDNIYVDKTLMIDRISSHIKKRSSKYICITRPRRFGKTINANMLGAYYTKGYDSHSIFDNLNIAKTDNYEKHMNQHYVIYIDFSRLPDPCNTYIQYIDYVKMNLFSDLQKAYGIEKQTGLSINDYLNKTKDSFIFILDEWDSIFYEKFMSEEDKKAYLKFLKGLLKDQPYVELAYMTGVLPIAKYSSGSELNMFIELNMLNSTLYTDFFGFTEEETKELTKKYPSISYDELAYWYNGYLTTDGKRIFNPRSVHLALTYGECRSYWTETGPMDEIAYYIENNVDAVKDDIVKMIAGIPVSIELDGYGASNLELRSRDEILSAMVVYGFLSYHDGKLQIPNHELMLKFQSTLKRESMGEVAEIVKRSDDILNATIKQDANAVAQYLEEIHNREIPFLQYNDENSLSCVITLCYLKARDYYEVTREDKSAKGYVDFLFKPIREGYPAIVMELKKDKSAEDAIAQIKEKNYMDRVRNSKEILLVGINYTNDTTDNKKHTCIIEKYK